MFKQILSLFILTLSSFALEAQVSKTINNSNLIIEGKLIEKTVKWNEDNTIIVTSNQLLISTIYKGIPKDSIIELITIGGELDGTVHFSPHEVSLVEGKKYFVFARIPDELTSNKILIKNFEVALFKETHESLVFFDGTKYLKSDFENEIFKITNYPKFHFSELITFLNVNDPCEIIQNESMDVIFENISLNQSLTHLEFDLSAKMNTPSLLLGDATFYIEYAEEFGSNVVSKSDIVFSKSNNLGEAYLINSMDIEENMLQINLISNFESNSAYPVKTSYEPLIHVSIKLSADLPLTMLNFADFNFGGHASIFCEGEYLPINNLNFGNPLTHVSSLTPKGLTYTLDNPQLVDNNTKFSFDIMAESLGGTTNYSDGDIIITYNSSGFGDNIASNNDFNFVRGNLISDPTVYPVTFHDFPGNGQFNILISGAQSNAIGQYTQLSSTPILLGTVTFNIKDCNEDRNISFDPFMSDSQIFSGHYSGSANTPNGFERYSPVNTIGQFDGKICNCEIPIITSFETPYAPELKIHGGVDEILTIKGENFGNWNEDKNTVIFPNGDKGTQGADDTMEAHASDFNWDDVYHWNDSEIMLKVPSTDKEEGLSNPAATGFFKVRNSCGTSDNSPEKLLIPYSVFNRRQLDWLGGKADKVTLRDVNSPGICFNFSDALPTWIKSEFEVALNQWCTKTGIDFLIGQDINKNVAQRDNINLISYSGNASSGDFFVISNSLLSGCPGNLGDVVFNEIDISFSGVSSNPSMQQLADMRTKIKHELGHAHMLNHAWSEEVLLQNQYIMHPNTKGNITDQDSEGANLIFSTSANIVNGACGIAIGNSACGSDCITSNITDTHINSFLEVSPNPTTNHIKLEVEGEILQNVDVKLTTASGEIIFSKYYSTFESLEKIDLPHISGVYYLIVNHSLGTISRKIVKL